MNLTTPHAKESLKQLSIIFTALLLGILVFSGFVIFFVVTNSGGIIGKNSASYITIKWIFLALVFILMPFAIIYHRNKTESIDKAIPVKEKLIIYRNSFILKICIIHFICMFNAFMLFFYGSLYLIVPLALFILYFLLNRPYIERISEELNLSHLEKNELKEKINE